MKRRIHVSSNSGHFVLNYNEIIYCEALGNYTKIIYKNEKSLLLTKCLNRIEALLPKDGFARIHRKYLVNTDLITKCALNGNHYVKLGSHIQLPVAARKVSLVREILKRI